LNLEEAEEMLRPEGLTSQEYPDNRDGDCAN